MNSTLHSLPVLILYPHNRCNCRCLMCDIWKTTNDSELSAQELERHLDDLAVLQVKWVVLSGGEPLMHTNLFEICELLRARGIRITVLSTGLLLERFAAQVVKHVDDVIVSLDGPPAIHDRVRRVPGAFSILERGVKAVHQQKPQFPIASRCTVQRENYFCLRETAQFARAIGLNSVSFLAADLTSEAFNRLGGWTIERQLSIGLDRQQIPILERELEALSDEWRGTGFVLESPEKLQRIAHHFKAHCGLDEPKSPRCNAPWLSAVVETDGTVRPCFFHRPIGSIKQQTLLQVLNSPQAVQFRQTLDVATNATCRRCVCSLYWTDNAVSPARQDIAL